MSEFLIPPSSADYEALAAWLLSAVKGFASVYGYAADRELTVTPFESGIGSPEGGYLNGAFNYWKSYGVQCYTAVNGVPDVINTAADANKNEGVQGFGLVQALINWVSEQNRIGSFPACAAAVIEKIEVTAPSPKLDGIHESEGKSLARWNFYIKVHYNGAL